LWLKAANNVYFGGAAGYAWTINNTGHFLTGADNTYDIGAVGANRPRTGYFANAIIAGNGFFAGTLASAAKWNSSGDGIATISNAGASDFDRLQFGGTSASFPALKRSTTSLQARLANDSAFTNIQGKLTTDNAYTAGAVVQTGYVTIYDSTGTAYKVLVGT